MAKSAGQAKASAPAEPSTSFESALTELQQIVTALEDNSLGLESSLSQFEKGIGLLRKCHAFLEQAEQKIEILVNFKSDGDVTTAPFDATPTGANADSKTLF